MTTYSTGNPVGSSDARDLYDNAENLDNAANSDNATWTDRLGQSRRTIAGIEQDAIAAIQNAGYVGTGTNDAVEDYAAGIEITQYNQIVRDPSSGEFWRVSGSETLPYTLTGAGVPEGGALVSVGDATLRQDLINKPANGRGALLVRGSVIYVDTIADLQALPTSELVDGQVVEVYEYHDGTGYGGGQFYWDASKLKSEHNGGTVIDPDKTFPLDWTVNSSIADWFQASTSGGNGCYLRRNSSNLHADNFGTYPGSVIDSSIPLLKMVKIAEDKQINESYAGTTSVVNAGPKFLFSDGVYQFKSLVSSTTLENIIIESEGRTFFIGDPLNDKTTSLFSFERLRQLYVKQIVFQNFDEVFSAQSNNLNESHWKFENCKSNACNLFIDTRSYAQSRSTLLEFSGVVSGFSMGNFGKIYCDNVVFNDCWLSSGSNSTDYIVANSNISFRSCMFVPTGTSSNNRSWLRFTTDDGAGGHVLDNHRGVSFYSSRLSNEGGNHPAVVCEYPVSLNVRATPAISFDTCAITASQAVPYEIGNSESGIVYLREFPASVVFKSCSFRSLGNVNAALVAKSDALTSEANDVFNVWMDEATTNNALRTAGESDSYRIARSLRGFINNPDAYTFRDIIEDGKTIVSSASNSGQLKTTFKIRTGYLDRNRRTPIAFNLLLTGLGRTDGADDFNYAGSSIYVVTVNGQYSGSHQDKISFTKIHGEAFGANLTGDANIVSLHFGGSETGSMTAPRSAEHTITCVFGANVKAGISKITPLLSKQTRYILQMSS